MTYQPLILRALSDLIRAFYRFPTMALTSHERQVLGGLLFREGPTLVERVAAAIARHPHLFPRQRHLPDELLGRQRRATALKALARGLGTLQQLAIDTYLFEQATAIHQARGVLRSIDDEAAAPELQQPDYFDRRMALLPAWLFLHDCLAPGKPVTSHVTVQRSEHPRATAADRLIDRLLNSRWRVAMSEISDC